MNIRLSLLIIPILLAAASLQAQDGTDTLVRNPVPTGQHKAIKGTPLALAPPTGYICDSSGTSFSDTSLGGWISLMYTRMIQPPLTLDLMKKTVELNLPEDSSVTVVDIKINDLPGFLLEVIRPDSGSKGGYRFLVAISNGTELTSLMCTLPWSAPPEDVDAMREALLSVIAVKKLGEE